MTNGHRFDADNHNYLLHIDHLSLGFSYMSFVIHEQLILRNPVALKNLFDPEAYNYLFNKTTGIISAIHHDKEFPIQNVFKNLAETDKEILEILNYTQSFEDEFGEEKKWSALQRVMEEGKYRFVDPLLEYMSRIKL